MNTYLGGPDWPFIAVLWSATVLAAGLTANGVVNLFAFRRPRASVAPDDRLPSISILVPARNEEAVIERCVRSLLAQNYPDFEVVVLDDNSADSTYDILCHLRDQDPRLRVLAGAALADGWCGKTYAVWQLAQAARGQYLLMTDADCEFASDALLMAVGAVAEHDADVVSLAPEYVCGGFWERLLIPLLVLIPIAFLPIALVRRSRRAIFSAANGAFVFVSRDTYLEIDGHRAVKGELAEDIIFAQHVKRSGKTLWYGDGSRVYRVRMYQSLAEIWAGFTRNVFPAFSCKLRIMLPTLVMVALVFILPPIAAAVGYATGAAWTVLALTPYLMIVALRWTIAAVLGRDDPFYALLNPLAWALAITIAIGSMIISGSTGAIWKDRQYVR